MYTVPARPLQCHLLAQKLNMQYPMRSWQEASLSKSSIISLLRSSLSNSLDQAVSLPYVKAGLPRRTIQLLAVIYQPRFRSLLLRLTIHCKKQGFHWLPLYQCVPYNPLAPPLSPCSVCPVVDPYLLLGLPLGGLLKGYYCSSAQFLDCGFQLRFQARVESSLADQVIIARYLPIGLSSRHISV